MTEWIRIIILATHVTQIWTIITLIRSTTQSAKNDLRHSLKLNCNNNYRHRISESVRVCFVNAQVHLPEILGACYGTDMRKAYILFPAPNSLSEITTEHHRWKKTSFGNCSYCELDPHHIATIYPQMVSRAFPKPFRKLYQNLIPYTIRNTYRFSKFFRDNSCTATRSLLILPIQKTATLTEFKLLLKFQMREVYTYIQ